MPNLTALNLLWLIPIYPLIAFVVIVIGRWTGSNKPKTGSYAVIGTTIMSLAHSLWILATWKGVSLPFEVNHVWLEAGFLKLSLGTYLDHAGMMMLLVVTSVSLLIHIYTRGYMTEDPGFSRFYAYLALFNFSMLSLVISSNLFQMYMFWEMVGVSSYLLIGFWFTRPSAAAAATKAFLMNRIGDFGLLIGILTFLFYSWHVWQGTLLDFSQMGPAGHFVLGVTGPGLFAVICLLIFMGPVAKSAQIPLHTWLPDAMEGPTPISALIHAATMVAAGVFLIARMYPVFTLSPLAMTVIAWVGAITAIVAATIALVQVDIKKALAYSTMSQLGYMVLAMGIGAYSAGLFHLMTHAFFKAMLFLCSGSVIHGCHEEQDMRNMGGLAKYMPRTHWTYLVGTIAITGVLPFSGFFSKDQIIGAAAEHTPLFIIAVLTAGMTAFYMFRTYFMTFTGAYRGHGHPHESPGVMTWPLMLLAIPSIFIGGLLSGLIHIPGVPVFGDLIHFGAPTSDVANWTIMLSSTAVAWLGFGLAWAMYRVQVISPAAIVKVCKPLYVLFWNKWFFDDLYGGLIAKGIYLRFAALSAWFDRTIIDGLVGLTGGSVSVGGSALRVIQNGRVQTYLVILAAFAILLTVVLLLV